MSIKLKFFLGFLACILLSILSISGVALQKILSVSESSFEGAAGKQLGSLGKMFGSFKDEFDKASK